MFIRIIAVNHCASVIMYKGGELWNYGNLIVMVIAIRSKELTHCSLVKRGN